MSKEQRKKGRKAAREEEGKQDCFGLCMVSVEHDGDGDLNISKTYISPQLKRQSRRNQC